MATKSFDIGSDEVIMPKCCTCAEKNITREGEKYCIDCQCYYCIPCTDMHNIFPLMKGHKLLDKADFSTTSLRSTLPCFPTERCHIHKAKVLEMYCGNHDEVVCTTCVVLSHRLCQDIHSIPDEIDSLYQQPASDETIKNLTAAKKNATVIKTNKLDLLNELKDHKKKATDSIRNSKEEMEAELKRLETEDLNEVNIEYGRKETGLLNTIKELDEMASNFQHSAYKLEKSSGNKAQEFVCVKIAEKNLVKAIKERNHLERSPDVKIDFSADLKIQNCLKESKSLGQVSTSYTVKQDKDVNIKLTEDRDTCNVWGSCFTADGQLLITDFDNKKLKRVDISKESIKDHLALKAGPIAVCQTSKQEAAVCLHNRTIQFVSLGDKMVTTRELDEKMDHDCDGMAYSKGQLFISDYKKSKVYIYDINGTLLKTITTDKSGKPIFRDPSHLCINCGNVYVADTRHGLVTLDIQGNHLSTFTDPDLEGPFGACTDGRGNIFVSGYHSSNIVQISESSKTKLGIISTDNSPVSVCFDPNQNKLAVTFHISNTIKVYELQ